MKHKFSHCCALLAALTVLPASGETIRAARCGGDGPKPFASLVPSLSYTMNVARTQAVSEFSYSEKTDTAYYRDPFNQLHSYKDEKDTTFQHSLFAIDRLIDTEGRFLLTDGLPMYLNLQQAAEGWRRFSFSPLQHLYWNRGILYSVESRSTSPGTTFFIHRFRPGDSSSRVTCRVDLNSSDEVTLAAGHSYPYVWFKSVKAVETGYKLRLYKWDVDRCRQRDSFEYKEIYKGNVEQVYRFDQIDATGIKLDHPTHHFVWEADGSCHYVQMENLNPMVLSYQKVVLSTWSKDVGLTLFFPHLGRQTTLKLNAPITELKARNVMMTSSGKEILLAPEIDGSDWHWLFRVGLDTYTN